MKKQIHVRLFLLFFMYWMFCLQPLTGLCQSSSEVIQIEFRNASELLPLFQGMLSTNGKASIDTHTNSVVITDTQERIEKIKSLIKRLDVPPQQVRVRVKFKEGLSTGNQSIQGSGSISGDNYKINIGKQKKDGISTRVSERNIRHNQRSDYFINVLSGSTAYIMAGENIVYRERWNYLLEKYARYNEQLTIQRIETGFDVKPVITGEYVNLEIIPRISHKGSGGRKKIIRFTEAAATVSVPLNQWVTIGSAQKKSNEVMEEILKYGVSNSSSSLSISLMVEK